MESSCALQCVHIHLHQYTHLHVCLRIHKYYSFGCQKELDFKEMADREQNLVVKRFTLNYMAGKWKSWEWCLTPVQSTFADPYALFLLYYYSLSLCFHSLKKSLTEFLEHC